MSGGIARVLERRARRRRRSDPWLYVAQWACLVGAFVAGWWVGR